MGADANSPPPSAGEGGPRACEGRERGETFPESSEPTPLPPALQAPSPTQIEPARFGQASADFGQARDPSGRGLSGGGIHVATLSPGADLAGFRAAARRLIAANVPPQATVWQTESLSLFGADTAPAEAPPLALPRAVTDLVPMVVPHRDPERYGLLYALIWRVLHGERALMEVASDPLVHRLHRMRKGIARDLHKMHAFLRFRRVPGEVASADEV